VKRIVTIGLLMTGMLGGALGQIDLSKLITGNQTSPEALTAIHFGPEGKLILHKRSRDQREAAHL